MLFQYTWNKSYERYLVFVLRRKRLLVEMCAQLLLKEAGELLKEAGNLFAFVKEACVPFVFCKEAEKKQVQTLDFLLLFCFFSASLGDVRTLAKEADFFSFIK